MATGYRLALASDYSPARPFADGVTTSPGTVSETFWVMSPGLRFCALAAYFRVEGTVVLQQVTYDEGDVVETKTLGREWDGASPQQFAGKKITAGTVSDLYTTSAEFSAAALTAEP